MRFLLVFLFSSQLVLGITFEELDFIRSLSNDKNSIIQNGTDSCNKYFLNCNNTGSWINTLPMFVSKQIHADAGAPEY